MWESFLDPEVLRPNLIAASMYIAAFELLKSTIVDRLKGFYTLSFDKNGERVVESRYQPEVASQNRSPVYASLDWLRESGAIDSNDLAIFEKVKEYRNRLAHTLVKMASEGMHADLPDRFAEMITLLDKIERWWITNVEMTTNPDHDGKNAEESEIIPGSIIGLRILMDVAMGSREYLQELRKHTPPAQ
jgi:hypothetical protein